MKMEEDITQTRIEELKIRSSVLQAPLEEQEMKFQKIESSISDLMNDLKKTSKISPPFFPIFSYVLIFIISIQ